MGHGEILGLGIKGREEELQHAAGGSVRSDFLLRVVPTGQVNKSLAKLGF